jgi:transposase
MTRRCAACLRYQKEIAGLARENGRLRNENAELKRKLEEAQRAGKRQAAPFSKGSPNPHPKTPGRKAGAEYGEHHRRAPPKQVDEIYEAPLPKRCDDCGGEIREEDVVPQFQEEVVRKKICRRFNVHIGRCCGCGKRHQGRHALQTSDALGAAESQIGPEAHALAVHMNKYLGLTYGKIQNFFQMGFSLRVTRATFCRGLLKIARKAEPIYGEILLIVRQSAVVYADETGWRVGGYGAYLWDLVTEAATAYLIGDRSSDVPLAVLGPEYDGTMGHDGYRSYDGFKKAQHQQCLRHFLTRCDEMIEEAHGRARAFPEAVRDLLRDTLDLRDRRDEKLVSAPGVKIAVGHLQHRLDRLLDNRFRNEANLRLASHLYRHRTELFTFLRDTKHRIEPTNWLAEQALRFAVVNRKVWGGNRTPAGAWAQGILMSLFRTWMQQGLDPIVCLVALLRGQALHALAEDLPRRILRLATSSWPPSD